ncbi:MAG: TonB-dependent receptor [Muribaculaceae bacterium]|nr:TonB-dependent receptor [Muribaculaceae bacterium]
MRHALLTILLLFIFDCTAQIAVKGTVYDSEKHPAGGVIVRLYVDGKPKAFATSAKDGSFSLKTASPGKEMYLKFLSQNHETLDMPLTDFKAPVTAYLKEKAFVLEEVTVKAPDRRIKGDTIVYDVAAMSKKGDRSIEDVIKRLPGIQVDDQGGISYDGKSIKHFYIENMDLMGRNYAVASRSINPADISTVSVYERHQDKKILQGREDSDKASLNLTLKKGRMLKPIGYMSGGAGAEAGDGLLWSGDLYGMLISPKNQTIISAKGNNDGHTFGSRKGEDAIQVFSPAPFGEPSIKHDRFVDNKSAFASANTLVKLNKDLTVKINSSYSYNNERFNGLTVTEYLNPDSEDILYSESVGNDLGYQNIGVSANIENNSTKFYFSDTFDFNGNFSRNSYGIDASALFNQNLKSDNYKFSNILKTMINSGERIFHINSETKYNNSPLGVMTARNITDDTDAVSQGVKTRSFFNRESTSLSWYLKNDISVGTSLSFEINHDSFSSSAVIPGKDDRRNDLSGWSIVTGAEPFFKCNILGVSWKTSLPLNLYNLRYRDIITADVNRFNRLLVDFNTSFSKKINQQNHFSISLGRKNEVGDIRDFIDSPVYTTFRNSSTMGSGNLKRSRNDFVRGAYSYRNILEGLYLTAQMSYKRVNYNTISIKDVSSSGTSSSLANSNSNSDLFTVIFNGSKDVRSLNTTFYLTGNAIWQQRESIRSSIKVNTNSSVYFVSGKVETYQFSDILMLSANASYTTQTQTFGGLLPKNSTNNLSISGKAAVFPVKNMEIFYLIDSFRVKLGENNYKNNTFMDAGIKYSMRRLDLELSARNLTDMRNYSYTIYHDMDITYSSYTLRPFEIILSAKFRF